MYNINCLLRLTNYLKETGIEVGLLINFAERVLMVAHHVNRENLVQAARSLPQKIYLGKSILTNRLPMCTV